MFSPTTRSPHSDEQEYIISAARNHDQHPVIVVRAGAGTARAYVLCQVANELKKHKASVLYLVFSKKNKNEAQVKLKGLADVHTINGFAYQRMKVGSLGRKVVNELYPKQITQILGINSKVCGVHSFAVAKYINQTLRSFCQSADSKVMPHHLMYSLCRGSNQDLASSVLRYSQSLFDILRPGISSQLPITHDIYTKAYQLDGAPGIKAYTFCIIEDAQNCNPATISILRNAESLMMVGDENQAIYKHGKGFKAMQAISGLELTLTQSLRFGPDIAKLANAVVFQKKDKPATLPVVGSISIPSTIGPVAAGVTHTRIYRSNLEMVLDALYLTDNGLPINVVGDLRGLKSKILSGWNLYQGNPHTKFSHPLLAPYKTWSELERAVHATYDIELMQIYQLISEYNCRVEDVIELLGSKWAPERAKVTLVSGYRSKGLEYENVVIGRDFDKTIEAARGTDAWDDEMNLLYVAITRGRLVLEPGSDFVRNLATNIGLI